MIGYPRSRTQCIGVQGSTGGGGGRPQDPTTPQNMVRERPPSWLRNPCNNATDARGPVRCFSPSSITRSPGRSLRAFLLFESLHPGAGGGGNVRCEAFGTGITENRILDPAETVRQCEHIRDTIGPLKPHSRAHRDPEHSLAWDLELAAAAVREKTTRQNLCLVANKLGNIRSVKKLIMDPLAQASLASSRIF